MIAAFMATKLGRALAWLGALLAAIIGAWLLGRREGGQAAQHKAKGAENDARKRMAKAAADAPGDKSGLVDRLRKHDF